MSKINPLAQFIDVKAKDILNLEQVLKLNIKKEYKNFCRIHHPDKKKTLTAGLNFLLLNNMVKLFYVVQRMITMLYGYLWGIRQCYLKN